MLGESFLYEHVPVFAASTVVVVVVVVASNVRLLFTM